MIVRVVIDTNVLVSALIGHGKPRRLVAELLEGHQVVSSRQMLAELVDVLSREKFKEAEKSQVNSFLSILSSRVVLVTVKQSFKTVVEDPDDDMVLSTAHEGKATYIVSGDGHLLNLKRFGGIRIVTVNEMLQLL
jgi:putative PIN family toxin of toxin-antitoxin system